MKILNTKSLFVLLHALFFLVACDFTMVRELDIERLDFPPKLSVTAILDGRTGVFDITLMEGNSLAKSQRVRLKYDNIRSGEIRLFEDGALLLSIPGPFDMSTDITQFGDNWRWGQNGFSRRLSGVATRPGSVYRLEVDVEGYPMAVSTSVMPAAPAVWAGMDTSAQVLMNGVREIGTVGYGLNNIGNQNWNESYPNRYWPVSVRVEVPDMNHYLALYVNKNELSMLGNRGYAWGIGASDLSILLEDGMDGELLSGEYVDLYLFPMLMTGNFRDISRNFYVAVDETVSRLNNDDAQLEDNPDFERITIRHSLTLRVMNITPATYRYYRSLTLQLNDTGIFAEQPITIAHNVENGYGSFAVYNATLITLLSWETHEWRKKEE